ncbi:hypothetical protein SPRG_05055 [Saprolegnia parasitica CBS 223.65]|uniref:non-specific serine/threonine protein kinase n=1 Tax=Saprolegnia parasitica (strain CBS 223.65) TaxID=695850 RepID=A0A067CHY1_SAPPC|nr:hypothetical protein SPRG_05055 [Saprolegnia parasitica CBS 223.65]KDO30344.1 hypothetical protein SPRG_05055 [Saprolegnia parasitica CBS 223.65]|eukprot:XP_012198954.1 hypothetical protein SPRG_05055 [Saprolegnia parasitica CBS 223.65]
MPAPSATSGGPRAALGVVVFAALLLLERNLHVPLPSTPAAVLSPFTMTVTSPDARCPVLQVDTVTEWHAGHRVHLSASSPLRSVTLVVDNWRRVSSSWNADATMRSPTTVDVVVQNSTKREFALVTEKAMWERPSAILSANVTTADGTHCVYTLPRHVSVGIYRRLGEPNTSYAPCSRMASKPIALGFGHTCAINGANRITCWGLNSYGQATPPTNSFIQVAAYDYHTCALSEFGYPTCWGAAYTQYINYSYVSAVLPATTPMATISAGGLHGCATTLNGTVLCWGANDLGQASPPAGRFQHASAGFRHTCGITYPDGKLVCWGSNDFGEATTPAGNDQYVQVMCGNQYTCALTSANVAKCWGLDNPNLKFTQVPDGLLFSFVGVSKTGSFSCGLLLNGSATCWGDPIAYKGLYNFAESTPAYPTFTSLALGQRNVCGTTAQGAIFCYGAGAANVPPSFVAKQSGYCYRPLTYGAGPSWLTDGSNNNSWLNTSYVGSNVDSSSGSGDSNETPRPAPLVLNISSYAYKKLDASGSQYGCGIDETGQGHCWGATVLSGSARMVVGAVEIAVSMAQQIFCALTLSRKVTCYATLIDGGGQFTGNAFVSPRDDFVVVSTKGIHICGLKGNGHIKCWGFNHDGQLVVPDLEYLYVSAGGYHTCAITSKYEVACWGRDNFGQTSGMPLSTKYRYVSSGYEHTCAIRIDDSVDCWGDNSRGETNAPAGILFLQIDAGWQHTCGVTKAWTLRCWGNNDFGQATPPPGLYYHVSAGRTHSCATSTSGVMTCWGDKAAKLTIPALVQPFSNVATAEYVRQLQANNSLTRMTCSTLGWGIALSTNLCASTSVFRGCPNVSSYSAALARCQVIGGRLPTAAEVQAGVLAVDVCQSVNNPVWTTTACILGTSVQGRITVIASPPSSNPLIPAPPTLTCTPTSTPSLPVCISEREFTACSLGSRCSQECVALAKSQYACTCDDGFSLTGDGATCAPVNAPRSAKTCKQLGWTRQYKQTCAPSTACLAATTYMDAAQACAAIGARLPRRAEVVGIAAFPTQCGTSAFWTSTKCAAGIAPGVITTNTATETCTNATATARVVCVADPDINECALGLASCTSQCWNVEGSYTCTCPSNQTLLNTGTGANVCVEAPTPMPVSTSNCGALGWTPLTGNTICTSSQSKPKVNQRRLKAEDTCPEAMAYDDAASFCATQGGRLPTLDEIAMNLHLLTRDSVCGINQPSQLIWSTSPCTRDQTPTIGVAATNAQLLSTAAMDTICLPMANATAYPVCVADMIVVGSCASSPHLCSWGCADVNAGYRCLCDLGHVLGNDSATCINGSQPTSTLTADGFPNPWAPAGTTALAARSYGLTSTSSSNTNDCAGVVSYATATALCQRAGARLPTSNELAADVALGSGCQLDYAMVWSATPCFLSNGTSGVVATAGSKLGLQTNPASCVDPATMLANVRCVKDPSRNQCAMSPCSQLCFNQNYGYACACNPGFSLAPDGVSCNPTSVPLSSKSCRDLGWTQFGVASGTCTRAISSCSTPTLQTVDDAGATCSGQGARLPTLPEVQMGLLFASSCASQRIWTSTACALFPPASQSPVIAPTMLLGFLTLTSATPGVVVCAAATDKLPTQCIADARDNLCAATNGTSLCPSDQQCVIGDKNGSASCACATGTNMDSTGACVPFTPLSTSTCKNLCWQTPSASPICSARRIGAPMFSIPDTSLSACALTWLRQCAPPVTAALAPSACAQLGSRLPTLTEVRAGLPPPVSSCSGFSYERVWTSTACMDRATMTPGVVASGVGAWPTSSHREVCVTSNDTVGPIQCVADVYANACTSGMHACHQLCLPSGASYACACHDQHQLGPDGASCSPMLPPLSLVTCAALGWTNVQQKSLCANARVNVTYLNEQGQAVRPTQPFTRTQMVCPTTLVSYNEAFSYCARLQARLPTLDEVLSDKTIGAGCGSDTTRVWTSTPCSVLGGDRSTPTYISLAGASRYLLLYPRQCTQTTQLAAVKCVANVNVK